MNINDLQKKYFDSEITVEEYIKEVFENIKNNNYNAFITLNEEKAIEKAKLLDKKLKENKKVDKLFGIPIAIKDNILTKDLRTTAASKSLKNFIPIYDADVITKLNETDAIIIGKTNMDEYAMGSSSETSYFGPTINPFNPELTPGGSSSGSAAAVAGDESVLALGTDTGGSVRNPADFCNVVGFAPSFGAISRYGVISMSNSFDRVGIISNTVDDALVLFNIIKGKSKNDFTSIDVEEFEESIDLKDLKVAKVELKDVYDVDETIHKRFDKAVQKLEENNISVDTVTLDHLEVLNQVYTVIMSIEAESNIAKIDGLRYGESVEQYDTTEDFYMRNRTENFGEEVKRRLALGNFFASKDNNQKYYKKSMQIRNKLKMQVEDILSKYDIILTPTTTALPKEKGKSTEDSYSSFDSGMFNIITNLTNLPSISIPMNESEQGSVQLTGNRNQDMKLLNIAKVIEGILK